MLRVKLREALETAEARLGERITYGELARLTGLSRATLEAIGSRPTYNPRLSTIDRLCEVLGCSPADILEFTPDSPPPPKKR
jgi:DNA-binding Xre family transcriptional regulator